MSSSAFDVVRTTTGINLKLSSSLISRSTWRPSFFGRFRSRRIRSGRGVPAYSPCRRRKAMAFLRRQGEYAGTPRPDLILLDLNLPKKDGRQVLREIKEDESFRLIPVVVLTTSKAEEDIVKSYSLHANCYVTKPLGLQQFVEVVQSIENFWFTIV